MVDDGEQTQATERQPPPFYSDITLVLENKQPDPVNPFDGLRSHIAAQHPDNALILDDDLRALKRLRGSDLPGSLLTYYRSLCLVQNRFPLFCDTAYFTWHDAFKQEQKATQQNIHLEKAAVLFNIGVTCHEIGLSYDRTTVRGRRDASQEFIAAASVFSYLRDNESSKASKGESTVDVTVECAGMLEQLMLAQAQECVCENFFVNQNTTPVVCAKLSRQVGLYYEEALNALNSPLLKDHFQEKWTAYLQLKAAMFYGEACLRHEEKDSADKAARLTSGFFRLTEARKLLNEGNSEFKTVLENLFLTVKSKLDEVSDDKNRELTTLSSQQLTEIPSLSVIEVLRDILYANKEKVYSDDLHCNRAATFARYTPMVDEIISRSAGDVGQQPRGLKRINEEASETPLSKRLKDQDRNLDVRSKLSAVLSAASPSASVSSTVSEVLRGLGLSFGDPLVHDKLAVIQEFSLARVAGRNLESNVTEFVLQLKKVKEHYEAKKPEACSLILSNLQDQVKTLAAQQEMQIAIGMDRFMVVKEKLISSLNGADRKEIDLLSLPYASDLATVGKITGFLKKLKTGRLEYTNEALSKMKINDLIVEAEKNYDVEDFHSCDAFLRRLASRVKMPRRFAN